VVDDADVQVVDEQGDVCPVEAAAQADVVQAAVCCRVTVPALSSRSVRTRQCGSMTGPLGVASGRAA
jgi:hypothetical protein